MLPRETCNLFFHCPITTFSVNGSKTFFCFWPHLDFDRKLKTQRKLGKSLWFFFFCLPSFQAKHGIISTVATCLIAYPGLFLVFPSKIPPLPLVRNLLPMLYRLHAFCSIRLSTQKPKKEAQKEQKIKTNLITILAALGVFSHCARATQLFPKKMSQRWRAMSKTLSLIWPAWDLNLR